MEMQGQATVEAVGIATAIALALSTIACALGATTGLLAPALARALGEVIGTSAHPAEAAALTDAEQRLLRAATVASGDRDRPDLADLGAALEARLGRPAGERLLTRIVGAEVAARAVPPCTVRRMAGARATYVPIGGSAPSIQVITLEQQDRWVAKATSPDPIEDLTRSGLGLVPGIGAAIALADIADALPLTAPVDGIEPGARAGDVVVEQDVTRAPELRATGFLRVRVLRTTGDGLRLVSDRLLHTTYPINATRCS